MPRPKLPTVLCLALLGALSCCRGSDAPRAAAAPPLPRTAPGTESAPAARPAAEEKEPAMPANQEIATFGAGCFWCIEAVLERVDGVLDVQSGYMGGFVDHPDYEQVCTGATGHAEVVKVTFDPAKLSYRELLDWFFRAHDPTTKDRQGPDVGTQYRSAIFFYSQAQQQEALAARERAQQHWERPIVTEITAAGTFWPAEDYHQDFFRKNPAQPYCRAMIPPKLKKLGLDK